MRQRLHDLFAMVLVAVPALGWVPLNAQDSVPLSALSHVHGVAIDPDDADRFYLATHHGLYSASRDGIAQRISANVDDFMGFTPHPREPGTYFASGHPANGGNLGFITSRDGGRTWRMLSPGADGPVDFHQIAVSRADPRVIYGVYRTLQVSRDGGATWRTIGPPPAGLIDLAASGRDPATLFAATERGLLVSRDNGRSWAIVSIDRRPVSMVETSDEGDVFAYVIGYGLIRSASDGATWGFVGLPERDHHIVHFAARGARYYAVTHSNRIFTSADSGQSWRRIGR